MTTEVECDAGRQAREFDTKWQRGGAPLLQLAVTTLLPITPPLLTLMPLEQLLKVLLGVVV